jgi:hypothetical protein
MSIISLLQEFDGREIGEDDHAEPIIGKLLPGLNQAEFKQLESIIPCRIPAHIFDLLSMTRGVEPALDLMDFSGLSLQSYAPLKDIFPTALVVAGDGLGNFWLVDLNEKSRDWGPVFFVCQKPAVVVWQAKTFEEFLSQIIAFASFEDGSAINLVYDNFAHRVAAENPNLISAEQAYHPGDPDFGLFVQSLKKGYQFIDLRNAKVGDGFSWKRWGDKTELLRNGNLRLFAYRKVPNFFQKLIGY